MVLQGTDSSALASAFAQAERMAHLGFWQWNPAEDHVRWSDELYRIYGLSPGEFGASFEGYLSLVHPDDRERVRATIERALATHSAVSFDERIVRPGGEVRRLHSWASASVDGSGHVREMFGTCLDVTELFEANEERAVFTSLVEHATDFIGIIELDGRIRFINEAGRRMVGLDSLEAARDRRVGDLLTPAGFKRFLDVDVPAVLREGHWEGDVDLVHQKTGAIIETMATSFVLRDAASGQPTCVAGVLRDVTARRAMEGQLQHAQKMEALGRLAAGVAHDFNNLLTVILGVSGLLRADRSVDPRAREQLAEIETAAQRGAGLTRQLLALSRQQVRQPRVLDLDEVVRDSARLLARLLPANVELQLSLASGEAHVRADAGQIEQVLLNLVVNARDAMPQGGPIAIATRARDARVELSVADRGVGMPPEVRARIFEPFFTTKEPGRGTGLGLATVYGIVQQSGGDVQVETEVNRGTKVVVSLPRVDEPADARGLLPSMGRSPRRGTVLLVEDDDAVRATVRRALEAAGYTVLDTASAETALRVHESHPQAVDVLVVDLGLPKVDGRVLAARVRERDARVPILFVSGYGDEDVLRGASALGPILAKPFSAQAVVEKVDDAMQTRKRQA